MTDRVAYLVAFSFFLLACCILSVWSWVQFIQWIAEDVKCP